MTIYFGHGEGELANKTSEAATNAEASNLAVILAVSFVAVVAILISAQLLSKPARTKPEAEKS